MNYKVQSKSFNTCLCQGSESWCLVSDKWCWHSSLCPMTAAGRCTATAWQQREREKERKRGTNKKQEKGRKMEVKCIKTEDASRGVRKKKVKKN